MLCVFFLRIHVYGGSYNDLMHGVIFVLDRYTSMDLLEYDETNTNEITATEVTEVTNLMSRRHIMFSDCW